MSHLIAHGRAHVTGGNWNDEVTLSHAFLNDDDTIEITAESPDGDATGDITITFPASAIEPAIIKRIRGRAR